MYLYSEPISDNWRTSMENYELVKYLIIDFLSSPQFSSWVRPTNDILL